MRSRFYHLLPRMRGFVIIKGLMPYTSSPRRIYIGIFLTLGILVGFHYFGWLRPFEQFFFYLITPLSSKTHSLSVKVGEEYKFFTDKEALLQSYAACSQGLEHQQLLESQNNLLTNENAELKKQLNYIQKQKVKTVLSEVVGREIAGIEKTIIINVGSNQGVKVGQPVITGEGILVGKVTRTEKTSALVRLITDTASKIEAGVTNVDKTIGIIEGGYGISLRMKFVPRSEVVKVDDQIITSGYEPLIPRGLLLGKVAEVENQANQGFQTISVLSLVDLNKLTTVSVLLTQ